MTEEMYKELFADCQRLLLDNLDPPDDAAYWDWLVSQSNYFGEKYGASDFVLALVLAVMDEIDRRYKAKNGSINGVEKGSSQGRVKGWSRTECAR